MWIVAVASVAVAFDLVVNGVLAGHVVVWEFDTPCGCMCAGLETQRTRQQLYMLRVCFNEDAFTCKAHHPAE